MCWFEIYYISNPNQVCIESGSLDTSSNTPSLLFASDSGEFKSPFDVKKHFQIAQKWIV